jgi:putative transposase
MFLVREFSFTHEAIRDWEARFASLLADQVRTRRRGQAGKSWEVDETSIKVCGKCGICIELSILMATWWTL